MEYRYETHCHSAQCSRCAKSSAQMLVYAYHKAGYAGLVLTDHFIYGNTAVPQDLPWEERMKRYYAAYLDAKAVADPLDFDVIFGFEHAYGDGKEVLIYGVELDFLLANPDIPELTLDALVERIHQAGGIVIQAHPFRDRYYVNMAVGPRTDIVDGIEVYNACNIPGEDPQALALMELKDFIMTSGGDIHKDTDERIGHAGVVLPHRVRTSREFADALKERKHGLMIQSKTVALPTIDILSSLLE